MELFHHDHEDAEPENTVEAPRAAKRVEPKPVAAEEDQAAAFAKRVRDVAPDISDEALVKLREDYQRAWPE